MAVVNPN